MIRARLAAPWVAVLGLAVLGAAAAGETPGDATRGRAVFAGKGCGRCHLRRDEGQGMGPPLEAIRRPQGMLELAGRLWNHAPAMFATVEQEGLKWPDMTREQMADLMAYLQADPTRDPTPVPLQGQVVLVRKGCLKCHRLRGEGGTEAIELTAYHGRYASPVVWATTIWNHAPRMAGAARRLGILYPRFSGDEMANLVEFLRSTTAATTK
ncbi:MAG TPA: c-type cytochrome [Methylomirabilota bacterium]|nr:c-type cytochrome [Methylomirabilota bacterium]